MTASMDQSPAAPLAGQRVVVTGAGGQLGRYLVPSLARAGATTVALGHREGPGIDHAVDIADPSAVTQLVTETTPTIVIHAAAMTDVDGCEKDPDLAGRINHVGSRNVALAAVAANAWLIAVSTDFVFPGTDPPYAEEAPTDPISVYGASKLAGEQAVLAASDRFAVARTAWVYGGRGKHFPRTVLTLLANRDTIEVVEDERGNPTFAGDLADALVQVTAHRPSGIVHLVNDGTASRFELAREVARLAGHDPDRVRPTTTEAFLKQYPLPARRPRDSSLRNGRAAALGVRLRPWREALAAYMPHLLAEDGAS